MPQRECEEFRRCLLPQPQEGRRLGIKTVDSLAKRTPTELASVRENDDLAGFAMAGEPCTCPAFQEPLITVCSISIVDIRVDLSHTLPQIGCKTAFILRIALWGDYLVRCFYAIK